MIRVSLKKPSLRLGATISGSVTWIPEPGRAANAREAIITIGWRTEGRGDKDSGTIKTIKSSFSEGAMPGATPVTFECAIPVDAPPTYNGKLIRIIWEIAVRVDIPWAIDEKHAESFEVLARRA
jgi:hypothetical protein